MTTHSRHPSVPSRTADAYFVSVVRGLFDDFFSTRASMPLESARRDMVRYESHAWFAELIYLPEDGPRYSPRIEFGVLPELFADPRHNRVDAMHMIPSECELRHYNLRWRYSNESEAHSSLLRVRDEIIAVHATPYLANTAQLRRLLDVRAEELDGDWALQIQLHNEEVSRQTAQSAFNIGDYESVVRHLTAIPATSRSASDRRMLYVAMKRCT